MSTVNRLRLAGAGLSLAAVITCSHVWGDGANKPLPLQPTSRSEVSGSASRAGESLVAAKFAQQPVVSYKSENGDVVFGAQIKPDLGSAAELPRDILVLVDTAANQSGDPYRLSKDLTKILNQTLKASDQISIWTVNIPSATRDLTGGFREPKSDKIAEAINKLDEGQYELVLSDAELGSGPTGRNVLAYARIKDYRPATALVTSYEPELKYRAARRRHQISIHTENLASLLSDVAELIGLRASRRYRPLGPAY